MAMQSLFRLRVIWTIFHMICWTKRSLPARRGAIPEKSEPRPERWEIGGSRSKTGAERAPQPAIRQQFAPGMRVQHPTWGEGMVLNSLIARRR